MDATGFLLSSQNSDGGWGYKVGGMSFVEPTSTAVLALAGDKLAEQASERGKEFLKDLQHNDGGWGIAASDSESGWMTAWGVWALAREEKPAALRGANWLLKTEGIRITDPATVEGIRQVFKMDARIVGWPWQAGDASWVFPTALALIALNATGFSAHPRVEQGVTYLLDRAIASGGWNIGNPFMLTGEPPATIVNTSLALISLGGFSVSGEVVDRAQKWLLLRLLDARTAIEIVWGAWAARMLGLEPPPVIERLESLQLANGSMDGNPFTTAVGMLSRANGNS